MLQGLIPYLPGLASTARGAIPLVTSGIMSAGLIGMAGLGLYSTSKISSDNQARNQLGWAELEQQNRYLSLRENELQQMSSWSNWDTSFGFSTGRSYDFEGEQAIYQSNALERINLEASLQAQRDELYYARQLALQANDLAQQQAIQQQILANELALQQAGFSNQLQLAEQYFQQDLVRDNLNFERNMLQSTLIHNSDVMMQDQRLTVQSQLQNVELQQEAEETSRYLNEQLYKEQHSFAKQFGDERNVNKLSYILVKLRSQLPKQAIHTSYISRDPRYNENPASEFDYARWDSVPDEHFVP